MRYQRNPALSLCLAISAYSSLYEKCSVFFYVKVFPFLSIQFTVYVYLFNDCSLHVCKAVAWEVEVGARRLAFVLVVDIPSVLIKSKLKDSACFSNVSFSAIILITSIRYTTLKLLQFTLLFMCPYPPSSKKNGFLLYLCCMGGFGRKAYSRDREHLDSLYAKDESKSIFWLYSVHHQDRRESNAFRKHCKHVK